MHALNFLSIAIVFAMSAYCFDLREVRIDGDRPEHFGLTDSEDQFKNLNCEHVDECEESKAEEKEVRCATDGNDYEGKCKLMRETCKDNFLGYLHLGECTAREKCLGHRETGIRKMNEGKHFVPDCSDQGYMPMQCHKFSGHCWCSDIKGAPIRGTVTMRDTPNCPSHTGTSGLHSSIVGPATTSRRTGTEVSLGISSSKPYHHPSVQANPFPSEAEIDQWWKVNHEGKDRKRKKSKEMIHGCAAKHKRNFNRNMLDQLRTEYMRTDSAKPGSRSELERESVAWKFLQLDSRSDGYLRKKEYAKMAKLVRQVIKPKKCAKKFPKICDANKDRRISRKEWIDCLINDPVSKPSKNSVKNTAKKGKKKWKSKLGRGRKSKIRPCEYEQKEVNETIKDGNQNVYSPKCSKTGTYNQIQCYGTLLERYCFCVDVYTGDMVEKTYVMNGKPENCPVSWPKCPPPLKAAKFLRQLMKFFAEFVQSKNSGFYSQSKEHLVIERVFGIFDADHNGYLQKAEKRRLKNLLKGKKTLWRCGRKIHKLCDLNSDNRISLKELIFCIDSKIGASQGNSVVKSDTRMEGIKHFIEYIQPEKGNKN